MGAHNDASASRRLQRIHLGCGLITPAGWINVDGSLNARLAKHPIVRRWFHALRLLPGDKIGVPWNPKVLIHDVRRPLPFPDSSASAIYASHIFEHLYLQEARNLFHDCHRVLADGGVLRIVVPDLHSIVREYLGERPFGALPQDSQSEPAADRLNRRLLLRSPAPPAGGMLYQLYSVWKDFHSHKWMYDADSLVFHFQEAHFSDVRSMAPHESRIEGIKEIEDPGRILNGEGICVEGIKRGSPKQS
jgi:SAM-dependent methyltransferase